MMINIAVVGAAMARRREELLRHQGGGVDPKLARELEELRRDVLKTKRDDAQAAIRVAYAVADAEARRITAAFERA